MVVRLGFGSNDIRGKINLDKHRRQFHCKLQAKVFGSYKNSILGFVSLSLFLLIFLEINLCHIRSFLLCYHCTMGVKNETEIWQKGWIAQKRHLDSFDAVKGLNSCSADPKYCKFTFTVDHNFLLFHFAVHARMNSFSL